MDGKPGSATSSIRFEELLDMSDQSVCPDCFSRNSIAYDISDTGFGNQNE